MTAFLPVSDWRLQKDETGARCDEHTSKFPGWKINLRNAGFASGVRSWGVKSCDLLRSLRAARRARQPFFSPASRQVMTWSPMWSRDGNLSDQIFANQGAKGGGRPSKGRVYIAAGQIEVFSALWATDRNDRGAGTPRFQLAFWRPGCSARFFIAARSSLYSRASGPDQ